MIARRSDRDVTFKLALAGVLVAISTALACGSSSDGVASDSPVIDSSEGTWYDRPHWPHDGDRIETANFVVYSDSASVEARQKTAAIAEEVWAELIDEFSVEGQMLRFPEAHTKIELLAYRDPNLLDCTGCADYGWLVIYSPDHPDHPTWDRFYGAVMRHELFHVLHFLLSGNEGHFDSWFTEGLAEVVSGGTTGGAIRGLDQLEHLTSTHGRASPITYKRGFSEDRIDFLYPMFQLAVEYLLDDDGLARSSVDMRNLITDVGEGATFAAAFEGRMGMGLHEYEAQFYDLMDDYLPQRRNPLFSPSWFLIISLLTTAVVIGVPTVVYRRARTSDGDEPGGLASIGFKAGVVLATAMLLVVFLLGLFLIGTAYQFNNAALAAGRPHAYWILLGYLAVSVGLTSWTVRRWVHRSRLAFLAVPLVLVASVVAVVAVQAAFAT